MKHENNFNNKELNNLLLKRKGGSTSIKIIDKLLEQPRNINQLSKILKLDYKTIKYHVTLFFELQYLEKGKEKYGPLYYPSDKLINSIVEYEEIKRIIE
ncbi:MAG: ArsR family transcriptional regulator [Methanobrevibacter sp.]|nr:ArsR family transcriptional regulator [Methanobrevibacter sp.]